MKCLKRALSLLLALMLAMSMMVTTAFAESSAEFTVGSPAANVQAGEEFTVPVSVTKNTGIGSFSLILNYNTNAFELVEIDCTVKAGFAGAVAEGNAANGKIGLMQVGTSTDTGLLANCTFKVKAGTDDGSYPISLVVDELYDEDFNDLTADIVPATVKVGEPAVETPFAGIKYTDYDGEESGYLPIKVDGTYNYSGLWDVPLYVVTLPEEYEYATLYFGEETEMMPTYADESGNMAMMDEWPSMGSYESYDIDFSVAPYFMPQMDLGGEWGPEPAYAVTYEIGDVGGDDEEVEFTYEVTDAVFNPVWGSNTPAALEGGMFNCAYVGRAFAFTYTLEPEMPDDCEVKNYVWTATNPAGESVIKTNDSSSFLLTPSADGMGSITLTVEYGPKTSLETRTFEKTVPIYFGAISTTLDETEATLTVGETKTLTATHTVEANIVWVSDNESVATVDQNGVVTAVAAGTANITAAANNKKATCVVTVEEPVEYSIALEPVRVVIPYEAGKTIDLSQYVTVSPEDAEYTWSDDAGSYTHLNQQAWNSAGTITAKMLSSMENEIIVLDNENVSKTFIPLKVTMVEDETQTASMVILAVAPSFDTAEVTLDAIGATGKQEVTIPAMQKELIAPAIGYNYTYTWTSSDESVATVAEDGTVTAVANGTAVITATEACGATASYTVKVNAPVDEPENPGQPEDSEAPFVVAVDGKNAELEVLDEMTFYVAYPMGKEAVVTAADGSEVVMGTMMGDVFDGNAITGADADYYGMSAADFNASFSAYKEIGEDSIGLPLMVIDQNGAQYVLLVEITNDEAEQPEEPDQPEEPAVPVTKIVFWTSNGSEALAQITVTEGSEVDAIACCTPRNTTEEALIFTSGDESTFTVENEEVAVGENGHTPVTIQGVKVGTATLTASPRSNRELKATLVVNVECGHIGKETTSSTEYSPTEGGTHSATTTTYCACGEPIGTSTASETCVDEDKDGQCDKCDGAVEVPVVSTSTVIFDSSVNGTWGSPITLKKLIVSGAAVKSYEWKNGACTVTLAAGTPADASITFAAEGISGGGGAGTLYVNGSKTNYTIQLANGEASVNVTVGSKYSFGSMATTKNVAFIIEGAETIPVESIVITPENPRVTASGSLQLVATVYPENATVKAVEWSTNADSTALTLTEDGRVIGNSMGLGRTYTVTATSKSNPEVRATCKVYLDYKKEDSITISRNSLSMKVGDTASLSATVSGEAFVTNTSVTWESSDDSVVTVSSSGAVTAVGGGTATITATSYYGLKAACEVTVEAEKTEVTLTPEFDASGESGQVGEAGASSASVYVGGSPLMLKANALVTWDVVSGADVVSIQAVNEVESSSVIVTALKAGTAQITAIAADGGQAAYTINAVEPEIAVDGMTAVLSGNATVSVGETAQVELFVMSDDADEVYNAFKFVVNYDSDKLEYTGSSIVTDASHNSNVNAENAGVLIIDGYGDNRAVSEDNALITLSFKARAVGKGEVTIAEAYANERATAVSNNVQAIDIVNGTAVVTIAEAANPVHTITFTGGTVNGGKTALNVVEGEELTFTLDKTENLKEVTVAGGTLTDNGDGSYTISGVTEDTTVTVTYKASYNVTIIGSGAEDASGEASVVENDDYTFTVQKKSGYTYTVTATVNNETVDVIETADGYVIGNVTGDVVITVNRTTSGGSGGGEGGDPVDPDDPDNPKPTDPPVEPEVTYNVNTVLNGGEAVDVDDVKNTDTEYTFSAHYADGVKLVKVTVNDTEVQYTANDDGTYTITAADGFDGDIVINYASEYTVNKPNGVTGEDTAVNGEDYTFTVEDENKTPIVKVDGEEVEATDNGDGTWTIPGDKVTGEITIELPIDITLGVVEYFKGDNFEMKLIVASTDTELADEQALTYDGNTMFWSETYDAYAWLVPVTGAFTAEDAKEFVAIGEGTAVEVVYTGDVNKTNTIDVNDAQLTYDLYNARYSDFSEVDREKMLRADVNGDMAVDSSDVTAIVSIYR